MAMLFGTKMLLVAVLGLAASVQLPGRRPRTLYQVLRDNIPGIPGRDYPILATVPTTFFSCRNRLPGYYADMAFASRCQMFHICQGGEKKDSFLCPRGTIFNQQTFVCELWNQVDCSSSRAFYGLNAEIGRELLNPGLPLANTVEGASTAQLGTDSGDFTSATRTTTNTNNYGSHKIGGLEATRNAAGSSRVTGIEEYQNTFDSSGTASATLQVGSESKPVAAQLKCYY